MPDIFTMFQRIIFSESVKTAGPKKKMQNRNDILVFIIFVKKK